MNNLTRTFFSRDSLQKMSDEKLQFELRDIRDQITRSRNNREANSTLEVELCYIQGEIDRRKPRGSTARNRVYRRPNNK